MTRNVIPHGLDVPSSERSGDVQVKTNKQDLRYLGFECNKDGGREFDFSITTLSHGTKVVSVEVPAFLFVGADRISLQEGPGICYEKLKQLLTDEQTCENRDRVQISADDVTRHRYLPKGHITVRHWKSQADKH